MTAPRPSKPSQPSPPSTKPPAPPPKTARDEAIAWAKAIGSALLIWIVLRSFLVEAFRMRNASTKNERNTIQMRSAEPIALAQAIASSRAVLGGGAGGLVEGGEGWEGLDGRGAVMDAPPNQR